MVERAALAGKWHEKRWGGVEVREVESPYPTGGVHGFRFVSQPLICQIGTDFEAAFS